MTIQLGRIKYDVMSEPLAGQIISGDHYFIKECDDFILFAIIDGLGHGIDAAIAAKKAIEILTIHFIEPIGTLVALCDKALLHTRGAAMTIARLDHNHILNYIGIGNVIGVCWTRDSNARLMSQPFFLEGGIVGSRLPPTIQVQEIALSLGDIIIFATDGIKPQFKSVMPTIESTEKIAKKIFNHHRNKNDDGLVVVVQLLQ